MCVSNIRREEWECLSLDKLIVWKTMDFYMPSQFLAYMRILFLLNCSFCEYRLFTKSHNVRGWKVPLWII